MGVFFKGLNGKMISRESLTGNASDAGRGGDEGMSEGLPLENVRKVNFDGRPLHDAKGIRQSNAAVGQSTWIDNPRLYAGAMIVEKIDQFPFVIALEKRKGVVGKGEFDFML